MDFVVSDVTKPIISVTQLQSRGIGAQFGPKGCSLTLQDGQHINLVQGQDSLAYLVPRGVAEHSGAVRSNPTAGLNVITVHHGRDKSSRRDVGEDPYAGFGLIHALGHTLSKSARATPSSSTSSGQEGLPQIKHQPIIEVREQPPSTPRNSTQAPRSPFCRTYSL